MTPLSEVVREMSEERDYVSGVTVADLDEWSVAITDHLARLEALASAWGEKRALYNEAGNNGGAVYGTCITQLRALLSPVEKP